MNCTERDQDLVLLQHDELTGWRKLATLHHLRSCPRCQEKFDQFTQVSRHIAGAIRQEAGMAPFAFPAVPTLAKATPVFAEARRPLLRPIVMASVSAIAAVASVSAYAYRAACLTPAEPVVSEYHRIVQAHATPHAPRRVARMCIPPPNGDAVDSSGRPTIFPYSTPVMNDHHDEK